MKNRINIIKSIAVLSVGLLFASCRYQEIVPLDYPAQKVYMSLASEVYLINEIPQVDGLQRFVINRDANTFRIPLGVSRSGIEPSGAVNVTVSTDDSVITDILHGEDGFDIEGDVELLPSVNYRIDSSVRIADGSRYAGFDLDIELDFLEADAPDKKYAVAVVIECDEREVNPSLDTMIIIIDTKVTL